MKSLRKTYNYQMEVLRVLAIFGVVLIHTTSKTLELSHFDVLRLPFTLFLNQFPRFAVPLFFFISGFVLQLNYSETIDVKKFYKKRLRLLIPYVLWSVIYFFFVQKDQDRRLLTFLTDLLTGDASYQLYFIPALYLLYLIFPFINKYVINKTKSGFWSGIFILQFLLLGIDYYFYSFPLTTAVKTAVFNLLFFSLGIMASHHQKLVETYIIKRMRWITTLAIVLLTGLWYEAQTLYSHTQDIHFVYSPWRPTLYAYAILSIPLLYFIAAKLKNIRGLMEYLSHISFFIFFVHVIFIHVFWRIFGSYIFVKTSGHIAEAFWFDLGVFTFVLGASILTAGIVKLIPKVSWVTGIF